MHIVHQIELHAAERADTKSAVTAARADVALVSMPFGPLFQPSLGLSLLKAALTPLDLTTRVHYFTLRFAELIGASLYARICNPGGVASPFSNDDLVGEWIFSEALFGADQLDCDGYIENVLRRRLRAEARQGADEARRALGEKLIQHILKTRERAPAFLDDCLATALRERPRIVGFTSLFEQQVASLALARRIKEQAPDTFIVFGGANCEGAMGAELARQFPFVDAVVSGEADLIFPEFVRRVLAGQAVDDLPGVHTGRRGGLSVLDNRPTNAPAVKDMDALPYPDYSDFFAQWGASQIDKRIPPRLLYETSRGCWWGERNHCTFCGLNGEGMAYRSKSAQRALDELLHLASQHPGCPVTVVDNILDMKYFKDFIPELTARQLELKLFYEIKANVRKEQVRQLRDAGITTVQPGIESFSTSVLSLMRKGVRGLQNIQLLKWCRELGVGPVWNILWGFPGESPAEYARMAEIIPLLTHLQPPGAAGPIRLDRFSPNFEKAEQYGLTDVTPYPAYHYVYALAPAAVANLAYFFTYNYRTPQDMAGYTRPVSAQVAAWQANHRRSELFAQDLGERLLICDLRPGARARLTALTGLQRSLYLACDSAQTVAQLQRTATMRMGREVSAAEIEESLRPLTERGLMIREESACLSLAILMGEYRPADWALDEFRRLAEPFLAQDGAMADFAEKHYKITITSPGPQAWERPAA